MAKVRPISSSRRRASTTSTSPTASRRARTKTRARLKGKAPPLDKARVRAAKELRPIQREVERALDTHIAAALPAIMRAAATGGEAAGLRALRKATQAARRAFSANVSRSRTAQAAKSVAGHVAKALGTTAASGRAGAAWRRTAARRVGSWGMADAEALQRKLTASVKSAARLGKGASARDLAARASRARGVVQTQVAIGRRRAANVAVDEVGNLQAVAERQAAKDRGESKYVWRTQGDDAVRESHEALDGTTREWSSSPLPGEEPSCRCWAEPIAAAEAA